MSNPTYEGTCFDRAVHYLAQGIDKLEAARVQLGIYFHNHPEFDNMVEYDVRECLGKLAPVLSALVTWDDYDDEGNVIPEKEEESEDGEP